jgi:outer membrane receptor protein involved in Fe transport
MLRRLLVPTVLSLAVVFLSASLLGAEESRKNYQLPAGDASATLKQFIEQSGEQLVYLVNTVQGVQTKAVSGSLTSREALSLLLAGTELRLRQDEKTGALTVTRDLPPNAEGATLTQSSARPEKEKAGGDEGVKMEAFKVSESRIDGLNSKGLLQAGMDAALYHDVITRVQMERLGLSSLEELFRYLPQTSSASTSLQSPVSNSSTSGGLTTKVSSIGLRGFSSSQTVILINGRALPRSNKFSGADISRIPIAAIERVEVLPYSGSAIYGSGAIGGAINIILRKNYSGQDITTYYGTSTEGGANEYRFTYLDGRSFNKGKTDLTYTVSYQHRDALCANERDYLDEALRRYGPDSTTVNAQGVRIFEEYILPAFAGTPATILVGNTPTSEVNDLGIPGAAGVRYASVPVGTTALNSQTLTPSSFTATAGKASLSPRYGRSILYEPIDALSFNAQLEHVFIKDKLSSYGEFTYGHNRRHYSMPQSLVFYLDETDPLNPFRTDVTPGFVGRPVTIFIDTPDIADPSVVYDDDAARALVGLKGQISEKWEWSLDGAFDYSHYRVDSFNPPNNLSDLVNLSPYSDPGPSAPVESRRAVYALLADHSTYPISSTQSTTYFDSLRSSSSNSTQYEANARVIGDVFELPAGPFRSSLYGKFQDWKFTSGQYMTASDAWSKLINNAPLEPGNDKSGGSRQVWMSALEISIPVISPRWHPIPIQSFEIEGSMSVENNRSQAWGSSVENPDRSVSADNKVIAGRMQLTKDLAFRGSYSEGFYPPDWGDYSAPVTTFTLPGVFADPKRGNTLQFTPMMTIRQGGNPNLKSEQANSQNYGIILSPRFIPGFVLNVDYWKISKVDAVVSTSFVNIISNPDAYGFLITRDEPTAADKALGWLGRITAIDARAINAARTYTEGFDIHGRYHLETQSSGAFEFNSGISFTNKFLIQATDSSPSYDTSNGSGPLRWRGNASLTWMRNRWSVTLTSRYVGKRYTTTTSPSPSYPGAMPIDGDHIPSYLHWDMQFSYDIPYRAEASGNWKNWISGTKLTLGVQNILNKAPSFVTNGSSFYNSADDPRQRYVYVQIKKSF